MSEIITTIETLDVNDFMTIEETAAFLRINRSTVSELLNTGKLPGIKCGRTWRISRAALLAQAELGDVPTRIIQATAQLAADLVAERIAELFAGAFTQQASTLRMAGRERR